MLGCCAEDYFCPTLGALSDLLRLSPDVAVCHTPYCSTLNHTPLLLLIGFGGY
jgi:hypothetical protein